MAPGSRVAVKQIVRGGGDGVWPDDPGGSGGQRLRAVGIDLDEQLPDRSQRIVLFGGDAADVVKVVQRPVAQRGRIGMFQGRPDVDDRLGSIDRLGRGTAWWFAGRPDRRLVRRFARRSGRWILRQRTGLDRLQRRQLLQTQTPRGQKWVRLRIGKLRIGSLRIGSLRIRILRIGSLRIWHDDQFRKPGPASIVGVAAGPPPSAGQWDLDNERSRPPTAGPEVATTFTVPRRRRGS